MNRERSLAILVFAVLLGLSGAVQAQVSNGGFEEWSQRGNITMPNGWTIDQFGSGRVAYADHPSAVAIWNWYSYAPGLLIAGEWEQATLVPTSLNQVRLPVTGRPKQLRGVYRYQLGQNSGASAGKVDSAFVYVLGTRWNPERGAPDTVILNTHPFLPTEVWTEFLVSLESDFIAAPDSIAIAFRSSGSGFCGPDSSTCCYLSLDDVYLDNVAGVSTPLFPTVASRVSPNPALESTEIVFDHNPGNARLRLVNEVGAEVRVVERVQGTSVRIDCTALPAGPYHYVLEDRAGHPLAAGRFVVSGR